MSKIVRHEWVEIIVPANSTLTRFNFPDLPNLRNVHLMNLKVYTVDQVAVSINNQLPVVSHTNVLHKMYVTLVNYGGKEFLHQAPAIQFNTLSANLNTSTNWFNNDTLDFTMQKVNYPKSYIQLTSPVGNTVDQTFVFSVFYTLPKAQEIADQGFNFWNKG
jgi:hypothetical protein